MKYLSYYTQQHVSDALNASGAFFAFSDKQFYEKADMSLKYVSMGAGLVCPKDNVKQLNEALDKATQIGVDADYNENGFNKIVRRQYFNYESQISMCTANARQSLEPYIQKYPNVFTYDAITKVFNECWEYAVDNDLF